MLACFGWITVIFRLMTCPVTCGSYIVSYITWLCIWFFFFLILREGELERTGSALPASLWPFKTTQPFRNPVPTSVIKATEAKPGICWDYTWPPLLVPNLSFIWPPFTQPVTWLTQIPPSDSLVSDFLYFPQGIPSCLPWSLGSRAR